MGEEGGGGGPPPLPPRATLPPPNVTAMLSALPPPSFHPPHILPSFLTAPASSEEPNGNDHPPAKPVHPSALKKARFSPFWCLVATNEEIWLQGLPPTPPKKEKSEELSKILQSHRQKVAPEAE